MDQLNIFSHFGLTENDIFVYNGLLKLGPSKTGPIIRKSGVASSRVYESLDRLAQKSLVSYEVKNNIKYYRAEPPTLLVEEAEKNILALKVTEKLVKQVSLEVPDRNLINTYVGKEAFKNAFIQNVNALKKNETISVIAFSKHHGRSKELRLFLKQLDDLMKVKKCTMRMLIDKEMKKMVETDRQYKTYISRYLPIGYFGPMAVNISSDEVMLSVWSEEPIVIRMKSSTLVKSFSNQFDFLWNLAKS